MLITMIKEQPGRDEVPFWFDPLCPWAWITSRWLLEVEQVRPVRADWRIMSLAYLNLVQREGNGLSEDYLNLMTRAWGPVRVCAAAAEHGGRGVLGPALHRDRHPAPQPKTSRRSRRHHRSPRGGGLARLAGRGSRKHGVRSAHQGLARRGVQRGRPGCRDARSPLGGTALFGPVITPAPRGEAAGRLWDGLVMVVGTDGFFELKRSRDRKPSFE